MCLLFKKVFFTRSPPRLFKKNAPASLPQHQHCPYKNNTAEYRQSTPWQKHHHPTKDNAQLRNEAGHDYQPETNQPKPIAVLNVVFFSATDNSRLKVKITTTGLIKKWADSTTGRQAWQTVKIVLTITNKCSIPSTQIF